MDGANRNDVRMLEPTLDAIAAAGLRIDVDTLHLDRGYDSGAVRDRFPRAGVEATNTCWSNCGKLRRNTDRRSRRRHAALCVATALLIVGRLIDWRNRWNP